MKKLFVAAAAILAFGATAAFADTIENFVGNTLTVTPASGPVIVAKYKADHTFTETIGDQSVSGTWRVNDGQICGTVEGQAEACHHIEAGKNVGDTWTQHDPAQGDVTLALTAGQ